jgi:hypothetical protein
VKNDCPQKWGRWFFTSPGKKLSISGNRLRVTPSRNGVAWPRDTVTSAEQAPVTPSLLSRKVVFDRLGRRRRSGRPARQDPAAIAYCNFKNIAFEEDHVFVPRRCFRLEFPLETKFQYERPLVRLEEDLRFRSFTH